MQPLRPPGRPPRRVPACMRRHRHCDRDRRCARCRCHRRRTCACRRNGHARYTCTFSPSRSRSRRRPSKGRYCKNKPPAPCEAIREDESELGTFMCALGTWRVLFVLSTGSRSWGATREHWSSSRGVWYVYHLRAVLATVADSAASAAAVCQRVLGWRRCPRARALHRCTHARYTGTYPPSRPYRRRRPPSGCHCRNKAARTPRKRLPMKTGRRVLARLHSAARARCLRVDWEPEYVEETLG